MTVEQVGIPVYSGLGAVAKVLLLMLSVCHICSTEHVARLYAHTTRPQHRAWTVLDHLRQRDMVETIKRENRPAIHRLTKSVRMKHGLPFVRSNSRIEHRLDITSLYMDMGMPNDFINEPRAEFVWNDQSWQLDPDAYTQGMLIEVQRSYLTSNRWAVKRRQYEAFFGSGVWREHFDTKPIVVIVQSHNQQPQTIGHGVNYDLRIVNHICEVM